MRVLHVYTEHRGRGGAERFAEVTMEHSRRMGLTVEAFTRSSDDLPRNFWGKLQAGWSSISPRTSLPEFAAALDAFQPDVVQLYDYFPLISPWIAPLCAKRGIPIVMYCVHYRLTCPVSTHYANGASCTRCTGGREYWAVLRNCRQNLPESLTVALHHSLVRNLKPLRNHISRFIAPSEFTREWLAEHAGVEASRITTITPFVDVPPTQVDPSKGEYIAFAGRFAREKGIDTLMRAAQISGLPFRLCRNQNHLVSIDLPGSVNQVVTRNREELESFYRGARLLVFPSEWFETFGLVGAEAMSHGVPVVAARIGALANLVEHEVNGLLFETGNASDLAEKISRLWHNPAMCRRLGQAAREKVLANWTIGEYFAQLLAVYEDVIPKRAGVRAANHALVGRHSNI